MWIRLPTLVLKLRGDVTRSQKQGYQWPHKKDLCPPILFLKSWKRQADQGKTGISCVFTAHFQTAHQEKCSNIQRKFYPSQVLPVLANEQQQSFFNKLVCAGVFNALVVFQSVARTDRQMIILGPVLSDRNQIEKANLTHSGTCPEMSLWILHWNLRNHIHTCDFTFAFVFATREQALGLTQWGTIGNKKWKTFQGGGASPLKSCRMQ